MARKNAAKWRRKFSNPKTKFALSVLIFSLIPKWSEANLWFNPQISNPNLRFKGKSRSKTLTFERFLGKLRASVSGSEGGRIRFLYQNVGFGLKFHFSRHPLFPSGKAHISCLTRIWGPKTSKSQAWRFLAGTPCLCIFSSLGKYYFA